MQLRAVYGDATLLQIEMEISDFKNRRGRINRLYGTGSPECGTDTRQQLVHPERLCDVVVRPGVKCLDFRTFFASDGKHYDRELRNRTQVTAELEPIRLRHG